MEGKSSNRQSFTSGISQRKIEERVVEFHGFGHIEACYGFESINESTGDFVRKTNSMLDFDRAEANKSVARGSVNGESTGVFKFDLLFQFTCTSSNT